MGELSGGQRRRVILASILVRDVSVIVLDEPTTHLDVDSKNFLISFLKSLHASGKTIIANLHNFSEIKQLSTRIIALREGKVFKEGSTREILRPSILNQIYDLTLSDRRGINIFLAVIICLHIALKIVFFSRIYSSSINIDKKLKHLFFLEGIFNPFGISFLGYSLKALPVREWTPKKGKLESYSNFFSKIFKTSFPEITPSTTNLLTVSNLSFSYHSKSKFISSIYRYFYRLTFQKHRLEESSVTRDPYQILKEINLNLRTKKFIAIVGLLTKISKKQKDRQIEEVLQNLSLIEEGNKPLWALSGGNRQKSIIARSIIQNAKVIVLDEPLSFLDIRSKILVLDYLNFLKNTYGISIIMVHHELTQVHEYLDEVIVVDGGYVSQHIKDVKNISITNF
ncbi:hypothetical protein PVNG_02485 [Plasmodium vivax North Korean]|uniref:ABC transporter domain-containing protein n=1 Tax=Plasmodium vivax North Korean TaxID=1035514 RepID=A0A0J9TMI8_PLAVI|nr:hypothetical protein PVNG_02485 [Plasmodium vivax North Korean]